MLQDVLTNRGIDLPNRPTELRAHQNVSRNVTLLSGNLTSNTNTVSAGVSARVYDRGVYGFASVADFGSESVAKMLKVASEKATFLGGRAGSSLGELPPLKPGNEEPQKIRGELPQKLLLDFARALDAYIAETYQDLAGRSVTISCLDMEKYLFVSNGEPTPLLISHSLVPRTNITVSFTLRDSAGVPVSLGRNFGGYGFFNDLFENPEALYEQLATLYERVGKKREGVHANAGMRLCVMGPDLAGILCHEAIGHTVEGDLILGGSIAGQYINQQVATELVTMVDFAHTVMGKTAPIPVVVDDEGVIAQDVTLIEQGVLKNFMHTRATAQKLGYESLGNGRAFTFSDEPLVRMRNTAILPGSSKLADIIASVDDGYYLVRSGNGQADSTSEFMFGIVEGYEIKNGQVGRAIRDTTISGVAFDMLKTIDMVSDDMVWSNGGMCGKKQPIPVGMGGPAVRCYMNIGGR